MKTVMVFGVFDGIHPGHENFLCQAKKLGDQLVVAVARDNVVEKLKGHLPISDEETRIAAIRLRSCVDQAVFGDITIGSFESVYQVKPDIIAFGYDQDQLASKLQDWIIETRAKIKTVNLKSYKPEEYKSSYARHKNNS